MVVLVEITTLADTITLTDVDCMALSHCGATDGRATVVPPCALLSCSFSGTCALRGETM